MKRKIVVSFLALFIVFLSGAVASTLSIRKSTATLNALIELHEIEDMRKNLLISIQTVQSDLYTVNTLLGQKVDTIIDNVGLLNGNVQKCTGCHHPPEIARRIAELGELVQDYQNALSFYITASANRKNIDRMKMDVAGIGNKLLSSTEKMSLAASKKLETMTSSAVKRIAHVQTILLITTIASFIFGLLVAVHLTRSVTTPIGILVSATRAIASGKLGSTVAYKDKTEFGELADHFNVMSSALKDGYTKLELEISERKMAETALQKSESFLNTMFDSIQDPFSIVDRNYRIIRVNEAYAALKKRKAGDLLGQTCYSVLHNGDAVCDDCIVSRTFQSGDSCAKEKCVSDPDGSETWIVIYTYPILDATGNPSHVIQYIRDITEMKHAEQALRQSEERYALAAQGANDGLWDWDLKTNTIYFSDRWKTMLGYEPGEIGDDPQEWLNRVHPDDRPQVDAKIAAHIRKENEQFEVEYRILHRDGAYRWMLSRGVAVLDREGRPQRMAGSQTDVTARKHAEEQLLHDAFHDSLTGLPNRALFLDRLQNVMNRAVRSPHHLYAVLFIDIDRFKVINDSLGHSFGDLLLIEVGRRIVSCLRLEDTVARLGGDEFAILLGDIKEAADALDVAERLQRVLSTSFQLQGHELCVSQSVGIAMKAHHYTEPEEILRDADIAMYQAKAKGKARYEVFDSSMHESVVQRLQMEADLRLAVEHDEQLALHYQPIVDLKTHSLIGFEALARWNHPKLGMVPPNEFIPLAEESGIIYRLGDWILRRACLQLRQWRKEFDLPPHFRISINVSSKSFLQQNFVKNLATIIEEAGVTPDGIAIEITESMIMESIDIALVTMEKLKEMGIHIHIDDFGTGYSSLSYLHHFPVNALKIDRSFIRKMSDSNDDREIVKTIISLAQNLSLDVIAEGIEDTHELLAIKSMQCQYAQGYLFSKPMTPTDAGAWIQGSKAVPI